MDVKGGQEESGPLPNELIEKIMAMVPFPQIFRLQLLSKAWLMRFKPISSLCHEEEKLFAAGFQKQVRERSRDWGSYYPIRGNEDSLFGYIQGSQIWQRLPPLCFLPKSLTERAGGAAGRQFPFDRRGNGLDLQHLHLDGVFLYGRRLDYINTARCFFVANIVTRKWRDLPPFHGSDFLFVTNWMKLVADASSEAYKLILFGQDCRNLIFSHTFDSKLGTWSTKSFVNVPDFGRSLMTSTYLKGVVYGAMGDNVRRAVSLTAFNVEEGTLEVRNVSFPSLFGPDYSVKLMVCTGRLMLIYTSDVGTPFQIRFAIVFEMDEKSLQWQQVARCCFDNFEVDLIDIPIHEDNSAFLELCEGDPFDRAMVVYDKHKDEWRCFQFNDKDYHYFSASSFEPGSNPFMEV